MPSKEVPWFRHDFNARRDPKLVALRLEQGIGGLGRYWILVEILREQPDYRLKLTKWAPKQLAEEWDCKTSEAQAFLESMVKEIELFKIKDGWLFSESLIRRMQALEERNAARAEAGKVAAASKWSGYSNQESRSDRLAKARSKGRHTKKEWEEMVAFFGLCVRCENPTAENKYCKDHIIPVYQGGDDSIRNLEPMCITCNASKGPDTTDWRIRFCQKRGIEMPTKWLPNACERLPMEGKGIEGKGREGKDAPPAPVYNPVDKMLKINPAFQISHKQLSVLMEACERHGSERMLAAYAGYQRAHPGKALRFFLEDFGEYLPAAMAPAREEGPRCPACRGPLEKDEELYGCAKCRTWYKPNGDGTLQIVKSEKEL